MTILEITRFKSLRAFTPYSAFTFICYPALRQTADYWTDIFGALSNNSEEIINIQSLVINSTDNYSSVDSILDCQADEKSFFFDFPNQILYFHVSPDTIPTIQNVAIGKSFGYTDKDLIYIEDIPYLPLIKSIPSLSQQADLQQYDQMAFVSGSVVMDNVDASFDDIIDDDTYGNDLLIYHLPEHEGDYLRNELIPLNSFYIENFTFTLAELSIAVQDKRKSQNINIISDFYEGGDPVPLIYGQVKSIEATVTAEGVAPTFRVASYLTDIGIVECKGDFGWQDVTPISVDLTTGTFVLSATYARSPGNGLGEDTGSILPTRVRNLIGYPNTSALGIIKDINTRTLGVEYNSSNYDTTKWEASEALISPIGIALTDQQKTFEAIKKIQSGCNIGFRYEINPTGKRTIKIDDWSLPIQHYISWHDIKDNLTLKVASDSSLLAAKVIVKYDTDSTYTYDTLYDAVYERYRQAPTLEVETYLLTEALAVERAEHEGDRFSIIPRVLECQLHGLQWYSVQIYDIISVELMIPGREYFGTWKAQIIAVNPALGSLYTNIEAVLIERII